MATLSTLSEGAQSIKDNTPSATLTPPTERTLQGDPPIESERVPTSADDHHKVSGFRFWMIFVAMMVSVFLCPLENSAVPIALPTIVQDLQGTEFVWVGSASSLGSTAVLPLIGGLAQIFGRRPVVLGSLVLFALGSGVAGGAQNMSTLIAGRAIQGIGGGGLLSLVEIVIADLVPLSERGAYCVFMGAVWAFAAVVGPLIGGVLAQRNWRWLFYMNLPLTAIAMALVWFFLHLKTPHDDVYTKMRRMDWTGNVLILLASTIILVALTWAGVKYPWASYHVLLPLLLGCLLTVAFFVYESKFAFEPVVPWELVNNRTAFLGYVGIFSQSIVAAAIYSYLPVYFQAALQQSPARSGVSFFGNAFLIPPSAIATGLTITFFKVYVPQNYFGWIMTCTGVGLLTTLKTTSPVEAWVGYQVIEGIGLGTLYVAPQYSVLAPVKITESAHALAFFGFVRSFSSAWGVTLGGTILQNELKKKLPRAFLDLFHGEGIGIAFAAIPKIGGLAEPLKTGVRDAFASSLRTMWFVMLAVSLLGFFTALGMEQLKMHEVTDESWGLEERKKPVDEEKDGRVQAS
ncbi:hypothetical protein FRC01_003310 [Tulasnella sp. 417]|nr:hypothetical protein FRC01_003310 [Tulasnella sp. 417]